MSLITGVQHEAGRTLVHYHLRQAYGYPDITRKFEILHSEIPDLDAPPEIGGAYPEWYEEVDVPSVGATLVFRCGEMRSGGGPPDEQIQGPYLKRAPATLVTKRAVEEDPQLRPGAWCP